MASTYFNQHDGLTRSLVKALAFHLSIVLLAVMANFIWKLEIFKGFKPEKKINIVQSSVRVDVVGMPKYTLQELKKMDLSANQPTVEPEPEIKKEVVNETSKVEFKTAKKKVNLSNLLANFSQKEVVKKTKVKKKKDIDPRVLKKLVLEGNKVSKGSSITGEQLDMSKQVFVSYIQGLPDKVRPNWKLPSYMLEKELQCRIQIFIGGDGSVLKMKLYESSGDKEYDKKAMQAIRASSPLPKPSNSILSQVATGQVILGFPL